MFWLFTADGWGDEDDIGLEPGGFVGLDCGEDVVAAGGCTPEDAGGGGVDGDGDGVVGAGGVEKE